MNAASAGLTVRAEARPEAHAVAAAFGKEAEARLVAALRAEGERALALAPLAVAPPRQGRGIGAALVRAGLAKVRAAGFDAVFVLGDPAYRGRFGFTPAAAAGYASPSAEPHFMGLALGRGPLRGSGAPVHARAFAALPSTSAAWIDIPAPLRRSCPPAPRLTRADGPPF